MAKDTHSFRDIDWHKVQVQIQEQYLDALKSFAGETVPPGHVDPIHSPWPSSNSDADAKGQGDVFAKLLEQSKVFYSLAEQFSGLLQRLSAIAADSDEWQAVLSDHFENMKQQLMQSSHAGQENLQPWLKAFSAALVFPEAFQKQEKSSFPDINAFFSIPGTGPGQGQGHEYQARLQQNARLWQAYLENYHKYEKVLSAIGRDSIDRLHEKIIHRARRDQKIHSLRELYRLWIQSQEEVYAETVFTEEYSELYGCLLNSLMEFRQHNQGLFAEILSAFNLPTHAEMQNISKAQQKLRRDIQLTQQQQQTNASAVEALKKELAEIRQHLAENQDRPKQNKT